MSINGIDMINGWVNATVGDLADYVNGRAFKPTEWKDTGKPIIRIQNLNKEAAKYNYSPLNHEEKYLIKYDDLLFAWSASLGVYIWRGDDAWLNQHIFKVIPKACTTKKFIFYLLEKITSELYAKAHGSGMVHVTKGKFESTEILLPPLPEQHRIVAKIEELFSELDKGIENLKTAQAQLKVYRQALLKHAFEGKLTAQWRAENQDKLETADALLKRVQQERMQHYQQQLIEWKAKGQGSKPKAPKTAAHLTTKELVELPDLPKGWAWIKYSELIESSQNGISKRIGTSGEEVIVLRLADISEQKVSFRNTRRIMLTEKELGSYRLTKNDLLCIRVNGSTDLVGRMVIIEEDADVAYCDHFIRYRLLASICNSRYLSSYFNAAPVRRYIDLNKVSSAGQNTVNQEMIGSITIAFSCKAEQDVIVELLEEQFSKIDYLNETIATSLLQAEALRQSILKKAFSGQLVPQDTNDEPAAELLARIKASKVIQTKPSRKAK